MFQDTSQLLPLIIPVALDRFLALLFVTECGQNAGQSFSWRASNSRIMSYRKRCVCVTKISG